MYIDRANDTTFGNNALVHLVALSHGASHMAAVMNDVSWSQLKASERKETYATFLSKLSELDLLTEEEVNSQYAHFLRCECKLMLQTTTVKMHASTVALQHIECTRKNEAIEANNEANNEAN